MMQHSPVLVVVRVRPMSRSEKMRGETEALKILSKVSIAMQKQGHALILLFVCV